MSGCVWFLLLIKILDLKNRGIKYIAGMKHIFKTAIVFVFLTFVGCSDSQGGSKSDIKVKGFYIGMPIQEAQAKLKEVVVPYWPVIGGEGPEKFLVIETESDGTKKIASLVFNVTADAEGKVTSFVFSSALNKDIFNARDMTPEQFCEQFVKAYGIPNMEPVDGGWIYNSDNGVLVIVRTDKSIMLKAVPSASERKSSFD